MGKSVHNEETRKLMEGILKLQSVEECYAFFEDLCTVNELLSLGQRFEVANMLRNHKTYNEVAEVISASTATISRVNRCLNYGTDGYQLVLSRMEKLEKKKIRFDRSWDLRGRCMLILIWLVRKYKKTRERIQTVQMNLFGLFIFKSDVR